MRKTLLQKLKQYDQDYNGEISYDEFQSLIEDNEVAKTLTEIEVSIVHFKALSEYVFEDPETGEKTLSISFAELMEMTLDMQGSKNARVYVYSNSKLERMFCNFYFLRIFRNHFLANSVIFVGKSQEN